MRTWLALIVYLAACATDVPDHVEPSGGGKADDTTETFGWANPVIAQEAGGVADPGVLAAPDGRYYMASTGGSNGLYPIRVSDDLVSWKHVGYIFPNGSKPAWIASHPWAPEIHYVGGRYLAFFTALPQGATLLALGVAVADNPLGPWTDRGVLKGIPDGEPILVDSPGAIDSHYFRDPLDGRHYMIWKHERNGLPPYGTPLFIQELAPDGLSLLGTRKELIRNDLPWEENLVEGPWMTFHDGYYYLFYSASAYYDYRYATGVARSKQANVPLATQLATFAAPRLDKHGPPILSSTASDCWQGPGHGSIVKGPDGADYYVYHAWEKNHVGGGSSRLGMLDRVTWKDGWPAINNGKPSLGNCDGL